jgi:DNA-binding LytR/AlgR family response regulator
VKQRFNRLIDQINQELALFISISMSVFLFILFFEPFNLENLEFNEKLVFEAGFGAIVFLFMVLARSVLPWLIRKRNQNDQEPVLPSYTGSFIILILSSTAFAFYLSYAGRVSITFHIMVKIVLICLAVVVSLRLNDLIRELRIQNESLISEKKTIQKQIEKFEEDHLNKSIEFVSENSSETLSLKVDDVALIKSADNYVEIIYREDDGFSRKLLRNTLKHIEMQIRPYSNFMRCHRICIVNMHHVEKLNRDYNNHWLTIRGLDEQIPVSRQYLLKLKEAI